MAVSYQKLWHSALEFSYAALAHEGSPAETAAQAKPEDLVTATVVTIHGKIIKVNKARKQVTLEVPEDKQ